MPSESTQKLGLVVLGMLMSIPAGLAAMPSGSPAEGTDVEPGVVVVFPVKGETSPGIERTIHLLSTVGVALPSSGTQFLDAGRLLEPLADGYRLLGPVVLDVCPQGVAPTGDAALKETLEKARRLIVLTEFEAARVALQEVHDGLPCVQTVVPRSLLHRLHFLLGVATRFEGDDGRAAEWFRLASAIDPKAGFDSSFPPSIWNAYVEGSSAAMGTPPCPLRVDVSSDIELFVDGEPVEFASVPALAPGYHLVQIRPSNPAGGDAPLVTMAFQTTRSGPIWLVDPAAAERIAGLRQVGEGQGLEQDLLVDLVSDWAASHEQAWALAVFTGKGARTLDRLLFIDTDARVAGDIPAWMRAGPGWSMAAGRPSGDTGLGKRIPPGVSGWELDAGTVLLQPLPPGDSRLYGLEVGGVRTIAGPYAAHVALAFGAVGVGGVGFRGVFTSFLAGVRHVSELPPFGFYFEGAMGGFKAPDTRATLTLHVRPGVYYRLVPGGGSTLGFWLGSSYLFSSSMGTRWLGMFGFEYRYLW